MGQLKYRENLNKEFKLFRSENLVFEKFELNQNEVNIFFNCRKVTIKYMNDYIVSVFIGDICENLKGTNAVILDSKIGSLGIRETDSEIFINGEEIQTCVNKNTSEIIFKDKFGNVVCEDYQPSFKDDDGNIYISKINNCHAYYGLGEKGGNLNKKFYYTENFNTDDPETTDDSVVYYKTIPFYVGLNDYKTYGLFFDNSFRSFFDMGKSFEDRIFFGAIDGQINYYFILGSSIKHVISNYSNLTGKMDMPPIWSLGYQQNRFSYSSAEEIRDIIENFNKKGLPIDVIYFDIDYMDGYRVMTFKTPEFENVNKLIDELKSKGIKVVTILDPAVKVDENYGVYQRGIKGKHFTKTPDGKIFVGAVWAGDSAFPDFSNQNCRKWWKEELKRFISNYKIDGIWNDMNEPCVFNNEFRTIPENCIHDSDFGVIEHKEFHNRYGFEMSRCSHEAQNELNPNIRDFSMTRATYAGGQRYSSIWTGDNMSLWSQMVMSIPMNANLGISGFSFVGNDVGGFGLDCTEELFIRWMQLGTFLPIFRNHSNMYTRRQEPWSFGDRAEKIVKSTIELRYKLLPYIYTCFYESHKKGIPVFRPLVMEFEKDKNVFDIKEEFMFGNNILVAPVLHKGERNKIVYLPEGNWYNYKTNEVFEGKRKYKFRCELDEILIFVKEGSILPTYEQKYMNTENRPDTVTFRVYGKNAGGMYYYDDGKTNDYKKGKYNFKLIKSVDKIVSEEFLHHGIEDEKREFIFID